MDWESGRVNEAACGSGRLLSVKKEQVRSRAGPSRATGAMAEGSSGRDEVCRIQQRFSARLE
jgi:hypothetical protein